MKNFIFQGLLFSSMLFFSSAQAAEYLVQRNPNFGTLEMAPAELKVLRSFEAFGKIYEVIEDSSGEALESPALQNFARRAWSRIEINHRYKLFGGSKAPKPDDLADFSPKPIVPNDSLFSQLWGMLNLGQNKGTRKADASVAQAWSLHQGSRNIVVGVMDTGIDYTHPDLKDNLWSTVVGDKLSFGYDAVHQDNDPRDEHYHGTHVAGTIGAKGNNGIGVAGVNWTTRIAAVQIFDKSGSTSLDAILRGLDWFYKNRDVIRVINHSWGGPGYSKSMFEAFKALDDAGVVNVMAAGNDAQRLEPAQNGKENTSYPAVYPLKNSLVVASIKNTGQVSKFSNYGNTSVHIAAPGEGIVSTTPKGNYETLSGTSMASPHVAGAVALLMSYRPSLSAAQVRERILSSADRVSGLNAVSMQGRRLNVFRALSAE